MLKHLKAIIQNSPAKTVKTAELETSLRLILPAGYHDEGYPGFARSLEQLCLEQIVFGWEKEVKYSD